MTQEYSKARQLAETAFSKTQSQFLAKGRARTEVETLVDARAEKTLRLKRARLAKEQSDRSRVAAALVSRRAASA
ncbi:hypothetical protein [Pararhizobium haloflavum]|uniref:hypothetical protein n=1 Tax=Pararhizobium haloflavum TaxID=2037914 RepID=UPI000C18AEC6|nr:hypothetical protein [Pararhizobium haloflavum]